MRNATLPRVLYSLRSSWTKYVGFTSTSLFALLGYTVYIFPGQLSLIGVRNVPYSVKEGRSGVQDARKSGGLAA